MRFTALPLPLPFLHLAHTESDLRTSLLGSRGRSESLPDITENAPAIHVIDDPNFRFLDLLSKEFPHFSPFSALGRSPRGLSSTAAAEMARQDRGDRER